MHLQISIYKANVNINIKVNTLSHESCIVGLDMSKVSVCFAEHNIIKGKNNETVTEQVSEVIEITKNYHNKREPYDYYEISVNTIPDGYEVIILYVKTNGKLGRLFKLAKK